MSKGNSGLFKGTLGTSFINSSSFEESYSDRGIQIPESIKSALSKLTQKGDYLKGSAEDFSMKNIGIMSKETGVEFARVTVNGETYLIRGDSKGTDIPPGILSKMKKSFGTLDFHSHPHNDDCVPSAADRKVMRILCEATGQRTSSIVTPNGKTVLFDEHGVLETGTVSNHIDDNYKAALLSLFGGQ